jgi:hypothetical protein
MNYPSFSSAQGNNKEQTKKPKPESNTGLMLVNKTGWAKPSRKPIVGNHG